MDAKSKVITGVEFNCMSSHTRRQSHTASNLKKTLQFSKRRTSPPYRGKGYRSCNL